MMRTGKKLLAIFLVLGILFSMLTALPAAAEGEEEVIESIEIEPISVMEGTNGYWAEAWNPETNEYDLQYYRYDFYDKLSYTITFNDGSDPIEGTGGYFEYDGEEYGFDVETNQSYENQWTAGNTYQATVSVLGKSVQVPVTITESPIESITVEPISIIEGTNGYWEEAYNPKTEDWDLQYFRYETNAISDNLNYTISFKDGSEPISGTGYFEYDGEDYWFDVYTNQSDQNQWTVGNTYQATVSVLGKSVQVPVTVIESPVAGIEVEPIMIVKGTNGRWDYDWNPETEEYDLQYYYYDVYDKLHYTIMLKDDSDPIVGKGRYFEYDGEEYRVTVNTDQSYENQWTVDHTYQVTVSVLGKSEQVPVTITESLIDNFTVEPISIIEGTSGYWCDEYNPETEEYDLGYYRYDIYGNIRYTATLKDGTVLKGSGNYIRYDGEEYYFGYSINQSYENQWTVGNTYQVAVSVMGKTVNVPVTIEAFPAKKIEILLSKPVDTIAGWDDAGHPIYQVPLFVFRIIMQDGTTMTRYSDSGEDIGLRVTHQQSTKPWTFDGDNTVTVSIGKVSTTFSAVLSDAKNYQYIEQNGGLFITDRSLTDEVLDIPSKIDGKPVKGIMNLGSALQSAKQIRIPDSVEMLSENAFSDYESPLESLYIGSGVSYLSPEMIRSNWKLKNIEVSAENPYYKSIDGVVYNKAGDTVVMYPIGKGSTFTVPDTVENIDIFYLYKNSLYEDVELIFGEHSNAYVVEDGVTYNKAKTRVIACDPQKTGEYIMPDSVTSIMDGAFAESSLSHVKVSDNVTDIVYRCFAGCGEMTIDLPANLQKISQQAFAGSRITNISLPNSLKQIDSRAFGYSALQEITIPGSVQTIDDSAFYYCRHLNELHLTEGIKAIGNSAFSSTAIQAVVVPDSVEMIGTSAFNCCSALQEVELGSGVRSIGLYAFTNDEKLASIKVNPGNTVYHSSGNCLIKTKNKTLFAGCKNSVIPDDGSVTSIGDNAFCGCTGLTNIIIPNSVTSIGSSAFSNCEGLTSISIPDSVTSIANEAFQNCSELSGLTLGKSITSIGENAFYGCKALTSVTIPDSVKEIGYAAFGNCKISDIHLGKGMSSIGRYVFADNPLTDVSLPEGVTEVAYGAFECESIETVQLPTSIKKISNRAFHGSKWFNSLENGYAGSILFYAANSNFNLDATDTKIDVKPGTTVIADMAFQNMSTLEEVTLPKGLLTIGNLAFFDCSSIQTITIPATVSYIAPDAFTGCTSLKAIQVDSANPYYCSVDGVLFNKEKTQLIVCPKRENQTYTVPNSVKNIKEYAFGLSGIEKLIIANKAEPEDFALNAALVARSLNSDSANGHYLGDEYERFAITVSCLKNSPAHQYATDHFLPVEFLEEYAITYNLNGGKNNTANPKSYTPLGAEIVLQNPTRSGYTFKGWYSDSKLTKKVTKIASGSTGKKTLYAKWEKTYTITYKLNSGTNNKSNPKTYTKIDATITLKNPTRKGYTFKGWYSDSKYKKKVTKIAKGSTGNKTLYAKWAKNTYKITYKLNSGKNNAKNPKTYTVTTATITLKNPTRKGYTFQGWYSDSKYKTKVTKITKGSTGNKTLYAKWKKK